ncbi:MAG: RNA polymerase sigma factor, partial [Gemmatimonadales bacterium]
MTCSARTPDSMSLALESLLRRFGGLLRGIARRYGLSAADADELCQDVRIRLWRALASDEKIADVRASYLHRTARSAALDLIRRRRARREEPFAEPGDTGERPAGVAAVVTGPD